MNINSPVTILIVDDHDIVRKGLTMVIARNKDLVVAGEASTGAEALAYLEKKHVDVVLLDIRLPDESGISICHKISTRWPDTKTIILTSYSGDETILQALSSGASGYLLKEINSSEIVNAISTVASGGSLLDPTVTSAVLRSIRRWPRTDIWSNLSQQEFSIIELISEGNTNREIATVLNLSPRTVKNYVSEIFVKLDVSNRAQAAALFAVKRAKRDLY